MRHILLALITFTTGAIVFGERGNVSLRQNVLSAARAVGDGVIIGRARCGAATWLLTDLPTLIEIRVPDRSISSRTVRGLVGDERPWGLACVGTGELWTLIDYRTLAKLSVSGEVMSRTKLRQPRLNVFGVNNVLLLQQPPAAAGSPLLAAVRTIDVNRSNPWPGPTATTESKTKIDVSSGLVACGVPFEAWLPCWIASQKEIVVSDGTPAHTSSVQPQFVASLAVDPHVPLWDVAVAPSSTLWILTAAVSAESGRRVGGRITRSNFRGDDLGGIDLMPKARVIVSAGARNAVVLTVGGALVEVSAP
jgi:hypothetical protein